VVTWTGLVRFHVLFVIDLATRRVEIAGITDQPHEAWMKQQARNLTDAVDGFLLKHRYVIMDRDPLFCHSFRGIGCAGFQGVGPFDAISSSVQPVSAVGTAVVPSCPSRTGGDLT